MKRRDMLRLAPLSLAGMTVSAGAEPGSRPLRKDGDPLSVRYLTRVRGMLRWIRDTQSENILEASHAIARRVAKGGTVWCNWDMGHNNSYDIFPERNGVPGYITMGYDEDKAGDGDVFISSRAGGPEKDVAKKDILVIASPCPWGGDARGQEYLRPAVREEKLRPYAHIWVENRITTHGAVMKLPGRPSPFGPVSGILGLVTFWMIQADACRVLAQNGKSVPVSGDEPRLSGDSVPWVDLDRPLMDDYFDKALMQLEMIEAERGNMRTIANMAVDSVLAGGKVHCYSRYRNSLAVEGHHRRGGLALTRGVCMRDGALVTMDGYVPFKGTAKDTVIMGVWEPDDEIDLKNLDVFRKTGMKIASIGPMTRDIKTPEGRTVPKEADVHVGRMCDTYGLFAVRGFERKVSPTSGPVINQIWWAVCMEIAEEIIRRTGNSPGVFFSGALIGGREHNNIMMQAYRERGY